MNKRRLNLLVLVCSAFLTLHAQQENRKDTTEQKKQVNNTEEIKLNLKAVKMISFDVFANDPLFNNEKLTLKPDETLPEVFPEKKKDLSLTLRPYTPDKKFYYDPIYKTRQSIPDSLIGRKKAFRDRYFYSNWAKNWQDGKVRKSREEIEAAGVRYVLGQERLGNRHVPSYTISPFNGGGISLGGGKYMSTTASGSTISGLDLMGAFTKEYWNVKGRKRRARTLEVLKHYGDSTTVLINHEIIR